MHRRLATLVLPLTALAACAAPSPRPSTRTVVETGVATARLAPLQDDGGGSSGGWHGSFSGHIGGRVLDDEMYWEPLEDQLALGLEIETRPDSFPLGLEFGLLAGVSQESDYQNSGVDLVSYIGEFYAGPRLTASLGRSVRPYVGGGVTLMSVTAEGEAAGPFGGTITVDDSDSAVGGYAHGGLQIDVADGFHIGADVRGVFGTDVTLFNTDGDADYVQVTLLLGGNW